mmetsp:Transcript_87294/g.174659  ORF Transcript_87294/g.174659 Transcript_87294/m.174659 type:complete len:339 (+) Transcript_87294:193-1209(+)
MGHSWKSLRATGRALPSAQRTHRGSPAWRRSTRKGWRPPRPAWRGTTSSRTEGSTGALSGPLRCLRLLCASFPVLLIRRQWESSQRCCRACPPSPILFSSFPQRCSWSLPPEEAERLHCRHLFPTAADAAAPRGRRRRRRCRRQKLLKRFLLPFFCLHVHCAVCRGISLRRPCFCPRPSLQPCALRSRRGLPWPARPPPRGHSTRPPWIAQWTTPTLSQSHCCAPRRRRRGGRRSWRRPRVAVRSRTRRRAKGASCKATGEARRLSTPNPARPPGLGARPLTRSPAGARRARRRWRCGRRTRRARPTSGVGSAAAPWQLSRRTCTDCAAARTGETPRR